MALNHHRLVAFGLDRPHVAGNSLGGLVALELARRGHVRSAHAISPAGFANRLESAIARASLWAGVRAPDAQAIPHARFVPLPGCGHIPTYDDPELVSRVMLDASLDVEASRTD